MISASEALQRLREGNRRYVSGEHRLEARLSGARRLELADGQDPFAVILGCSDSRVPMEEVFDQGLGDLFVIRVAGNVIESTLTGSVEFGVEILNAPLVVVLGHEGCGGVNATLQALEYPDEASDSPNLGAIVDRIRPSVEPLLRDPDLKADRDALIERGVRNNVRVSAEYLRNESNILKRLIRENGLQVVGAEYYLASGEVDFFDGALLHG